LKKFICLLIIVIVAAIVGYKVYPMLNNQENDVENAINTVESEKADTKEDTEEKLSNETMYEEVISSYKNAYEELDLEDYESEEKILAKYDMVSMTLIEHVKRYEDNDISLTYEFYDIDSNGVDELIVGASGAPGAIYSLNKKDNKIVKVYYQDTMERGDLSIYDNGTIVSSGAGGAALHYYEFGKISEEDSSYKLLEKIEEEYEMENEAPTYRDATSGKVLDYKSYDEIVDKYILDSEKVEFTNYKNI